MTNTTDTNTNTVDFGAGIAEVPVVETKKPVSVAEQLSKLPTTSARIRFLKEQGLTMYKISKILGIRPQHVRNVLITPVKNPRT